MTNSGGTRLNIFDNLQVDFSLPKYVNRMKKATENEERTGVGRQMRFPRFRRRGGNEFMATGGTLAVPSVGVFSAVVSSGAASGVSNSNKITWLDKIFNRDKVEKIRKAKLEEANHKNWIIDPPIEEDIRELMSVEEFFKSVKNSTEELVLLNDRFKNYEVACAYLKKTGQEALLEEMEVDLEIHRAESQLYAVGLHKLITEEQLAKFI